MTISCSRLIEVVEHDHARTTARFRPQQLQALEAGSPMRTLAERLGALALLENRRQRTAWQREAAQAFSEGRMRAGVGLFAEHQKLRAHSTQESARARLVRSWWRDRQQHSERSALLLAYRRDDERALNEAARALKREAGELGQDHRVETERGARRFARGDRVMFLRNDRALGVANGSLGEVLRIRGDGMRVRLDEGREVVLSTKEYRPSSTATRRRCTRPKG